MYNNNFVLFCKTYRGDFERFKILKNSVDQFNKNNIPFYISCPHSDKELFLSLKNNTEEYNFVILTDEEILNCTNNPQDWNSQQFVKIAFSNINIAKFYLIIDSDSYFIKNFYLNDFLFDEDTPYIVMYEGKNFKEICSIINDKNIFDLAKKIKEYFGRNGKDYQFLTTPIIFSSKLLKELQRLYNFSELFKISPLEAYWHGEFLLYSNIIPYKPCELFFKCFNYQFEYSFWRKSGELERDIAKYYLGIVMQNRWVKSSIFKNSFVSYFNRKISRLIHCYYFDRKYIKKNKKTITYYREFFVEFIKECFKNIK